MLVGCRFDGYSPSVVGPEVGAVASTVPGSGECGTFQRYPKFDGTIA